MSCTGKKFRLISRIVWLLIVLLLVVGLSAMAAGNDPAKDVSGKNVQIPQSAQDYYNRGTDYTNKGQYSLAIEDLDKAISLNPHYAEFYFKRGEAYFKNCQFDQAMADFDKTIELQPKNYAAYANRGATLIIKGQCDKASSDFSHAITICNEIITKNPREAEAYFYRGMVYGMEGQYDEAIVDFDKTIEINPNHAQAYFKRGFIYLTFNRIDLALDDYNRSIILDPQNAQAYYNRGYAYNTEDEYDLAIMDFSQVIKMQPDNVAAYVQRGKAYADKGLDKLAKEDYDKADVLNPQLASSLKALMTFRSISKSHIDGNVPDKADFDHFLLRDIKDYFKTGEDAVVKYELLRIGPTQVGIGWPIYYLWVEINDKDIHHEGAMRLAAQQKKLFAVEKFVSKEEIKQDMHSINKLFPPSVCERIVKKIL